jgi:beta-glucuronidase
MVKNRVIEEATNWYHKHNKPVLMSEYGSDTVEGLHILPAYVWSEEFQVRQFSKHFEAFDHLRKEGFFIGEFVWNFADFKTAQSKYKFKKSHPKKLNNSFIRSKAYTRVGGNKKGVFTRTRQPKAAAHHLRKRYFELAKEIEYFANVPNDLYEYTSEIAFKVKDEL